jgi:hypothetical protein
MKSALYTITLLILAVLVGGWAVTDAHAQASWYNDSWDYRQKVTIKSSQVDSDLTDFPVYVDLATMSSGFFASVQSDGGDIRVTEADGTTEVAREVARIDTASSTGQLHFKAPSISSTSDTEFYIYYGNSDASNYADSSTYGAENVWTNSQAGVWHLDEDSGDAIDSTSNNNDGTTKNGATQGVGGQVGQAYDFDGTDDYVEGKNPPVTGTDPRTVSAWFKTSSTGNDTVVYWGAEDATLGGEAWRVRVEDGEIWLRIFLGETSWGTVGDYNDGNWHHLVIKAPANATLSDT